MDIENLCLAEREQLLGKWTEAFFSAYPLDSVGFLRTSTDRFANPVSQITSDSLNLLLGAIIGQDAEPQEVKSALRRLIELRSIQDLNPARAVGAVYRLKTVLRELILPKARQEAALLDQYLELESRLDGLALLAFDLYAAAREKVFELRVDELKRNQAQILRWAQHYRPDEPKSRGVEE